MKKQAVFYLMIASASYGSFVVLTKHLLNQGQHPLALVASTAIIFIAFSCAYNSTQTTRIKKITTTDWKKIIILGILATFIGRMLMFEGQALTSAINAGFLVKLTAITTIPFAHYMNKEKLKKTAWIATAIMLIGTYFLTTQGQITNINTGDLLLILLAIILGYTNPLAKQVMAQVKAFLTASLRLSIGATLQTITIALIIGTSIITPITTEPLLLLTLGALGISYLFTFFKGIELAGAAKATIFFLLSAVFSTGLAITFLNETLHPAQLGGGALILTGAYILAKPSKTILTHET